MIALDVSNTRKYLRANRSLPAEPNEVVELAGGVSNVVLLVTNPASGGRFVLKQARGRLRVKEEWLCPVERIWREVEVLRICGELLQMRNVPARRDGLRNRGLPECCVPQVLWEDRENYVYAMTAAPDEHRTWKEMLLAGEADASVEIAKACGELLATLHGASWHNAAIAERLDDRAYFDQLRLDPYYRHVARVHPDLVPVVERLLLSVWDNRHCLVHGDFSPKNLLVWPGRILLIDFEVGHYGDPAFDLGFFLTHLILKSVWAGERGCEYVELVRQFWDAYLSVLGQKISDAELAALEGRMLLNLAGCMLVRVDGKSPVDYLSGQDREHVRRLAIAWMKNEPCDLKSALQQASTEY